jgi:hypothetical protein
MGYLPTGLKQGKIKNNQHYNQTKIKNQLKHTKKF